MQKEIWSVLWCRFASLDLPLRRRGLSQLMCTRSLLNEFRWKIFKYSKALILHSIELFKNWMSDFCFIRVFLFDQIIATARGYVGNFLELSPLISRPSLTDYMYTSFDGNMAGCYCFFVGIDLHCCARSHLISQSFLTDHTMNLTGQICYISILVNIIYVKYTKKIINFSQY